MDDAFALAAVSALIVTSDRDVLVQTAQSLRLVASITQWDAKVTERGRQSERGS